MRHQSGHIQESELQRLINNGEAPTVEISDHLENCISCFNTYVALLELRYDSDTVPSDIPISVWRRPGSLRRVRARLLGAGLLAAAAAAVFVLGPVIRDALWTPNPVPSSRTMVGQCTFEFRDSAGQLSAEEFSVCDLYWDDGLLFRILGPAKVTWVQQQGITAHLERGTFLVSRDNDTPLIVHNAIGKIEFLGTRVLLDQEGAIEVTKGEVRVNRVDGQETFSISAGFHLRSDGVVVPISAKRSAQIARIFAYTDPNDPALDSWPAIFFPAVQTGIQTVILLNGTILRGVVILEGENLVIISRTDVSRIPRSQIKRVEFQTR